MFEDGVEEACAAAYLDLIGELANTAIDAAGTLLTKASASAHRISAARAASGSTNAIQRYLPGRWRSYTGVRVFGDELWRANI